MLDTKSPLATALLIAGVVGASPAPAAGIVDAYASMAIGNLRFQFDDPDAFLVWEDDWLGTVLASAQDTDSPSDSDYDEYLGNDDSIQAVAQTAHVYSEANYAVVDGLNVAIEPDPGSVAADTYSELELAGKGKQAYGEAVADFDNFFSILSSNPLGDTVTTTILLDYAGALGGTANEQGFFDILTGAFMELYDVDDGTGDVLFPELAYDEVFDQASGTNTSYANSLIGTLSITYEIPYDDLHWFIAQADSEVYGAVPLPGTLPLLLLGAGLFAWRRRR
jgi:hypothetical protein